MITLRDYQVEKRDEAINILRNHGIVYLAAEVRTGKTLISLSIVNDMKYGRCLFVTKKTAISGIEVDYKKSEYKFHLHVTNYEQLHNIVDEYDVIILDEAHSLGAFPKPSKRAKLAKQLFETKPIIYLSGTPNPESFSQLYHQFWVSIYSPWAAEYSSFYKWARTYVDKRQKKIRGFMINDYSRGRKELIQNDIKHLIVNLSQQQAGFSQFVDETVLRVAINPDIYKLMEVLKRDKIYRMKSGEFIMGDTPARMMRSFHQLCGGTIKVDSGERYTLDRSKVDFIKSYFVGQKIAIFYVYIAEGNLLRKTFPNYTGDPQKFEKSNDLIFIKQIVSGREGVTLSTADCLVMYNIDFSATSYFQAKARMQTKDRIKAAKLYWIFSDKGIESKIYGVVQGKKKFTTHYFKRDYLKN